MPRNTEAGEDYRIVDITDRQLDLPDLDFWLFDESIVLLIHFNDDDTFREREILESPPDLAKYLGWRDYALEHSVPFSVPVEDKPHRTRQNPAICRRCGTHCHSAGSAP
ncbi:DUF6879 family protein [Lentzea tibetensis]|uniref:DUF6879 family protein n=1 Tax=Lentzea tibetensis TaxID=2591470 RepID=UPI002E25E877|nr:DUF6879 family protein [Lentzea tibetensis]